MAKFNEKAWVAQELAKFTDDNYVQLRAAHYKMVEMAAEYDMPAPTAQVELIRQADEKFGA